MKQRGLRSILTSGATLCVALAFTGDVTAQSDNASCRAEIARFCAQVAAGKGRVAQCLEESYWQLSPACQEHTKTVAAGLKETLHACQDDMLLHCTRADVVGGRGSQCLARKPGLSPACATLANLL